MIDSATRTAMRGLDRTTVGIVAGTLLALFSTGALAATTDENEKQKSLEACLQKVEAVDQKIDPVDREETANLLSDAADMCHAGHPAAAERLAAIAMDLNDLRRSVMTE